MSELITVEDTMLHMHLGPNGGLVYAMEYLLQNIDWLMEKLGKFRDHYIIFDCPGQVIFNLIGVLGLCWNFLLLLSFLIILKF